LPEANRWSGLPVLFDEVFTGLYRLGRFSAASFLDTHPDISVHAKLLTGGLLPLSTTLASDSIFSAFLGDEKADALLHGHSYTAHPIGCHVASTALNTMEELSSGPVWASYRGAWKPSAAASPVYPEDNGPRGSVALQPGSGTWSMWSKRTVTTLSQHPRVDSVLALGSVLAVSLKAQDGVGYTSNAAIGLRDALLVDRAATGINIHSRILGNVLYLMASMTTQPDHLSRVENTLIEQLDKA
jgi:dethiobiotin synthetase/adenosylmethionine--8-amino-7-oxononanoate aminotransferase